MAVSLQDPVFVAQKVQHTLEHIGAHGMTKEIFRVLLEKLVARGIQLQFIPFEEADADAGGGTAKLSGACTIYGVYVRKVSAATDNYFKVYDDATDDTTAGDQIIALALLNTAQEAVQVNPDGLPFGTGIVVTQHTTSIGTSDGSDGGNGFLVIGA